MLTIRTLANNMAWTLKKVYGIETTDAMLQSVNHGLLCPLSDRGEDIFAIVLNNQQWKS